MKQTLLILSTLFCVLTYGQNITFPDSDFKQFLLNSRIDYDENGTVFPLIDANNDNEISQLEAQEVIRLNSFYVTVTNLEGLQFFTNLKSLELYVSSITQFNFPTLSALEVLNLSNVVAVINFTNFSVAGNTNLKKLTISENTLTNLDLSSNLNLTDLNIFAPSLTSLNLSNLSNLRYLSYYGQMTTLDISDCVNLLTFYAYSNAPSTNTPLLNQLTSIDLSNQSRLINLYLGGNNLTTLDLSNCTNLEVIDISNNQLTSVNLQNVAYVKNFYCMNNQLTTLNVNEMFNLQTLDCSNNALTSLFTKNGIIEEIIDLTGNPNISEICCDENEIVYLENQAALNGIVTISINSDCGIAVSSLRMYPNPIIDVFHLESDAVISKVEVFNINSLRVMQDESGSNTIDMTTLEAGVYFVKVYFGDEITTMKLIKS
jgi:Leucine-rich repeat (LRR) protein